MKIRSLLLAFLLLAASLLGVDRPVMGGWVTHGANVSVTTQPPVTNKFQTLKTCGGGWVVGADLSPNGVRFMRGDVFFGYIWGNDSTWHNLVTTASMPAALQGFGGTG